MWGGIGVMNGWFRGHYVHAKNIFGKVEIMQ